MKNRKRSHAVTMAALTVFIVLSFACATNQPDNSSGQTANVAESQSQIVTSQPETGINEREVATRDTSDNLNENIPAGTVTAVTDVTVSPDSASVDRGNSRQFSATVSGIGNPNQTVTWTISGNTSRGTNINADGVLTVAEDETLTTLTITATSTADTSKNGNAAVAVTQGITTFNVTNVYTWNSAINAIRNGGYGQTYIINVIGNITVPVIAENLFGAVRDLTVTIQGNGTLSINTTGNLLQIGSGQTVIIRQVTLRGHQNNNASLVLIRNGGSFRMEDNASVTGNTRVNTGGGGGVYVDGGIFTLSGGTISGNTASGGNLSGGGSGGGVFVNGGTFTMSGGTISGNTGRAGSIIGGQSVGGGGGVYVYSGTFTLSGGTISGNTSSGYNAVNGGGGVLVYGGNFIMQGGTISGNTESGYYAINGGGGVLVYGGNFTMQGGTISGNTVSSQNNSGGGGVFVNNGNFTKTGGIIYGRDASLNFRNTAAGQGHAVYWSSGNRWRNATAGVGDSSNNDVFWTND